MKKFIIGFASALLLCISAYTSYTWYLETFVDNPVVWAKGMYPLGNKQAYIIELNKGEVDESGDTILPENMFYTFRMPNEEKQQPYLSGRHIGQSKIDLNDYLGKKVYIDGNFSMGVPTILKDENIPEYLIREDKAILNIESLTLAE